MRWSVDERSEVRMMRCSFWVAIVMAVCGCSRDVPPPVTEANKPEASPQLESPVVQTPVVEPKKDVEPSKEAEPPKVEQPPKVEEPPKQVADTGAAYNVGDLVARFDDAVVFLKSQDALGETVSVGTGCIVDKSGIVATNRHVVSDAARAVAQFRDGKESPVAGWVAVDKLHDLVLLKLESVPENAESFSPGPIELRQGDALIAIGHPSEFRFTVTEGIVSAHCVRPRTCPSSISRDCTRIRIRAGSRPPRRFLGAAVVAR